MIFIWGAIIFHDNTNVGGGGGRRRMQMGRGWLRLMERAVEAAAARGFVLGVAAATLRHTSHIDTVHIYREVYRDERIDKR